MILVFLEVICYVTLFILRQGFLYCLKKHDEFYISFSLPGYINLYIGIKKRLNWNVNKNVMKKLSISANIFL